MPAKGRDFLGTFQKAAQTEKGGFIICAKTTITSPHDVPQVHLGCDLESQHKIGVVGVSKQFVQNNQSLSVSESVDLHAAGADFGEQTAARWTNFAKWMQDNGLLDSDVRGSDAFTDKFQGQ